MRLPDCPHCGTAYCYVGFNMVECLNYSCPYFSIEHVKKVQKERDEEEREEQRQWSNDHREDSL